MSALRAFAVAAFLTMAAAFVACGCGAALADLDDPVYADVAAKLAACRAEGRAAAADGGGDAGMAAYERCKCAHALPCSDGGSK